MEQKNKLKVGHTVELKREPLKEIIRNVVLYTRSDNFHLDHAEEYMVLLGAFMKRFPVTGKVTSFGAREKGHERFVGVNFKSSLGETGEMYYSEKDLRRIYKKRG